MHLSPQVHAPTFLITSACVTRGTHGVHNLEISRQQWARRRRGYEWRKLHSPSQTLKKLCQLKLFLRWSHGFVHWQKIACRTTWTKVNYSWGVSCFYFKWLYNTVQKSEREAVRQFSTEVAGVCQASCWIWILLGCNGCSSRWLRWFLSSQFSKFCQVGICVEYTSKYSESLDTETMSCSTG